MSVALRLEEMLSAAKVPPEKVNKLAEELEKSLKEEYVVKSELKLAYQDLTHAMSTQGKDVMNHVTLSETRLAHRVDMLYLKSSVTLGGIVVVCLGIFFALLKAFP
jgi:hypothetical protein